MTIMFVHYDLAGIAMLRDTIGKKVMNNYENREVRMKRILMLRQIEICNLLHYHYIPFFF